MEALRAVGAFFGIQWDTAALDRGNARVDGSISAVKALGTALLSSAVVVGLRNFVDSYAQAGSEINDASDRIGIGTQSLQELQFAASQSGVRVEQMNNALSSLSARAESARSGSGAAAEALRALGVHATDAHGQVRPVSDLMDDIAAGMDRVQNPAQRVRYAMDLFGGSGRRLVGVLHGGTGGLAEMRAQVQALGGGMSEEGVAAADAYGDAMGRWNIAMMSIKTTIAVFLLPKIQAVTDTVSHVIAAFTRFTHGTHLIEAAVIGASIAMAARYLPAIRNGIAALTAFTRAQALSMLGVIALILIVDDLLALFSGGHSVIGEFLDSMLGTGAAQNAVQSLKESWQDLIDTVREARELLSWDPSGRTSAPSERGARGRPRGEGRTGFVQMNPNATGDFTGTVSGTRGVNVPRPGGTGGGSTSVDDHSRNVFNIHAQDPTAIARAIERREQQRRAAADAAHPIPQRDQ